MSMEEQYTLAERLAACIIQNRDCRSKVTKEAYVPAFEAFEAACVPAMEALEQEKTPVSELSGQVLDALSAQWQNAGTREGALLQETDRIVLALFLIPALQRRATDRAQMLAVCLQEAWQTRDPQSRFRLVRFETIADGFQKKLLKACYITTAVCQSLGKPDNCEELTAFRAFRDEYLLHQPDGKTLIAAYYETAPGILVCIGICADAAQRLRSIWQEFLSPCYEALVRGDKQLCMTRYIRMVLTLQQTYLGETTKNLRSCEL